MSVNKFTDRPKSRRTQAMFYKAKLLYIRCCSRSTGSGFDSRLVFDYIFYDVF
jgi:hypothetical protein